MNFNFAPALTPAAGLTLLGAALALALTLGAALALAAGLTLLGAALTLVSAAAHALDAGSKAGERRWIAFEKWLFDAPGSPAWEEEEEDDEAPPLTEEDLKNIEEHEAEEELKEALRMRVYQAM